VWRSIRRKDKPGSWGAAVAVGPRGAFVLDHRYIVRETHQPFFMATWDVNPFDFLEAALGCKGSLRPDVATVHGARAAFSHIDGDGIANLSLDVPGGSRFSGQVILDRVLKRYDFPITVGPIAGRVDQKALGTRKLVALGRSILSQPNVQPGCHGYAHPLNWKTGVVGLKWRGYRFSPAFETTEAIEVINRDLLGGKRRVEIFLWTGNCLPTEKAMAECARMGVENMNGGDSRYDGTHRSITNIAPLSRPVGRYRQIYAAAQNENTYTNNWRSNFGGFRSVIETFTRTESPRRLLPVNVYYHFFSGERTAALRAVQAAYDWCVKQPLCWIHAAEYTKSVRGFLRARVGRTPAGGYWIEDFAPCPSVRLDQSDKHVDMKRSRGVMGYTHHGGSLYVALAPVKRAEVVLSNTAPTRPHLRRSTALLRNVRFRDGAWLARARLYARGFIELRGYGPGSKWAARVGGAPHTVTADRAGTLTIPLPRVAGKWV